MLEGENGNGEVNMQLGYVVKWGMGITACVMTGMILWFNSTRASSESVTILKEQLTESVKEVKELIRSNSGELKTLVNSNNVDLKELLTQATALLDSRLSTLDDRVNSIQEQQNSRSQMFGEFKARLESLEREVGKP